jgi:hypothetical protein
MDFISNNLESHGDLRKHYGELVGRVTPSAPPIGNPRVWRAADWHVFTT